MSRRRFRPNLALVCMLAVIPATLCHAQTYKVGESSATRSQNPQKSDDQQKSLGWGSNIQNARLARAAEMALNSGNYNEAMDYAQRAAQAAPGDAQLWFLLGYAARLAGKTNRSIDAYNRGLQIQPTALDGLSGLAQTYAKVGRRDEAEGLLNRVLAIAPNRSEEAALLGELLMHFGHDDEAAGILVRSEQARPSPRTELLLALCYQHLKDFDRANRYLELAKRGDPNNPEVQRALAGFYRQSGDYSAAVAALQSIPHKNPEIVAELGYTYQLEGKKDEAAKFYAQAANARPQDLSLQLSAAQAEVSMEDVTDAGPFLKRAAAIDPQNYRLHAVEGQIAFFEDKYTVALHEYTAALDHLPQTPPEGPLYRTELRMNLVDIFHAMQDQAGAQHQLDAALTEINQLDEQGSERAEFLRLRVRVRISAGDLAGARSDIKEALAINAKDPNTLQLEADVLAKSGQPEEAAAVYRKVLAIDSTNRLALTSLGYLARETGHESEAEQYFRKLLQLDANSYLPYLALGDMYVARKEYAKAEVYYRKGYGLAPHNSLIVAGGMNAAIEAHHFNLADQWLSRSNAEMQQEPHLLREKERYLSFIGDYRGSADVGREVIQKMPTDRDVVVYLGYDLLHLDRYDELLQLTLKYESLLPQEPDIPLLAGYVHKQAGQLEQAQDDFTNAIERDATVTTAYVNRGFVRNDLRQPDAAANDFRSALRLEPDNGEAHLGLAYSSLALHQSRQALRQTQLAESQMGDSMALHVIRATAYGELGSWLRAANEYRVVLKYTPNDASIHIALAGTLYGLHRYRDSITELQSAEKLAPANGLVYAQLARSYAQLRDRGQVSHYIELAERARESDPAKESSIFISDGEALSFIGDQDAAMARFARALGLPQTDRLEVRLAVAHLMVQKGDVEGARRQIALGMMEAQTGEAPPPTGQDYLQIGDVFLGIHDFQLAQKYFERALVAGAPETEVRIGLANSYLAEGDTARAEGQISLISADPNNSTESDPSYQYLLTEANVLRQRHQNVRALTTFAQATEASGEDDTATRELLQAGANEGMLINRRISFLSNFSVDPVFEPTTVYPLDAKLDVINPIPGRQSLLPLPRSSVETQWTGAYHLHLGEIPDISGFFQMRNAKGEISLPSADTIVDRDTTDYSFNIGINPTVRWGNNVFTFNGGIQETIRRDSSDPVDMDQNLFRQFVYLSTSSFYNILSVNGYAIHETGPFTLSGLHSRTLDGSLDFRVGRPWGKTAFVTGVGSQDEQFDPVIREFFFTSSYTGMERQVGEKLKIRAVGEYMRSWRVDLNRYAVADALRPAGSVEYSPTRNWIVQGSFAYARNPGFHAYDAVQSGFSVSYGTAIRRVYSEGKDEVKLRYPIRFTVGVQQEDFYNFSGAGSLQLRPYVSLSIF